MNPDFFRPPKEEPLPECDERLYWHKRFNFASWLFLIFSFWALFASETPWSAMLALGTSFGFWFVDSICETRHVMWHMKRNDGGDHDLR